MFRDLYIINKNNYITKVCNIQNPKKVTCFSSFLFHFLLFIDLLFSQLILINYSIYLIIFIKQDCFFRFVKFWLCFVYGSSCWICLILPLRHFIIYTNIKSNFHTMESNYKPKKKWITCQWYQFLGWEFWQTFSICICK